MTRLVRYVLTVFIITLGFLTIVGTGGSDNNGIEEPFVNSQINSDNFAALIANALIISTLPEEAYGYGPVITHEIGDFCVTGSKVVFPTGFSYHVIYTDCATSTLFWDGYIVIPVDDDNGLVTFGDEVSGEDFYVYHISNPTFLYRYLSAGDSVAFNGDLNFSRVVSRDQLLLAGGTLEITTRTNGKSSVHTLSKYLRDSVFDSATSPSLITLKLSGDMESSLMTSLQYWTATPFKRLSDSYPYEGEFIIASTIDTSNARITAYSDAETVRLELDSNGDGIYELSYDSTWSAISNLLDTSLGSDRFLYYWK